MSPAVLSLFSVLLLVFAAQACDIIRSGLSEEEKTLVLRTHNELRNKVAMGGVAGQPPAANMIQLVWDEEAGQLAQERSDTCEFEHDQPLQKGNGDPMGQNLAMIMYGGSRFSGNKKRKESLVQMVNDWFVEHKDYRFGDRFRSNTGHYTQLAWADTEAVGCGYTIYKDYGRTNHYLTCNYYKAGNWMGKKPYIIGSRNCPNYNLRNSNEYPALCAK